MKSVLKLAVATAALLAAQPALAHHHDCVNADGKIVKTDGTIVKNDGSVTEKCHMHKQHMTKTTTTESRVRNNDGTTTTHYESRYAANTYDNQPRSTFLGYRVQSYDVPGAQYEGLHPTRN